MRAAVPLLLLAACDLYIRDDDTDAALPIDAGPGITVCPGGPVGNPPVDPGTVRHADRLATAGNEFAWDVARAPGNAYYVVGELEGGGGQGLVACFEPDGDVAWTVYDSSVLRWRAVIVDNEGAPVVLGDLRAGGSVLRRLRPADDPRPPLSINFSSTSGSANLAGIAPGPGGLSVLVAGDFTGSVAIGSQVLTSAGGTDGFTAHIDLGTADIVPLLQFGGTEDDGATGIALNDNVIAVSGFARSASVMLAGQTLAGNGGDDALVYRSDTSGITQSARRIGGSGDERGLGVAVDEVGRTFLLTDRSIIAHDEILQERWTTALDSPIVAHLWDLAAAGGKVYTAGMYFAPGTLGGVELPDPNDAPRFVAELAADTGAPGWIVSGEGPTIDAALELGANLLVAGTYLVNFDMGGARLDPSTPHDIYAMEIAR